MTCASHKFTRQFGKSKSEPSPQQHEGLIKAHGRPLISLGISSLSSSDLQPLLDCCPVLEHIAVYRYHWLREKRYSHATLAAMDVFVWVPISKSYAQSGASYDAASEQRRESMPALRIIRYIWGFSNANRLWYVPPPVLAPVYHDTVVTEVIWWDDYTTALPQSSWLAFIVSHGSEMHGIDAEDPDYVPDAEDDGGSVEDSESDSDSDSDAITVGDDEMETDEDIGVVEDISAEEALEIYRRMLH
ncbi:hypothetical protein B0H15DRAFT_927142 [Mycena belliarum]|uniref:Uncharacterized protein n=1 Tax=Mycena belliarum TaxID=1033014 RepID=A0AAD6UFZ1_9AGAR|nr:hypothetical protein B0H15DRAFT_927142 [Mycena belliae]